MLRAADAWSWQLCRHSCAECEIMDASPTFHPFLCLHDSLRGSFTFCTAVRIFTLTLSTTMQRLLASVWLLNPECEGIRSFYSVRSSLSNDTALCTEDLSVLKDVLQASAVPYLVWFKVQLCYLWHYIHSACSSIFPRRLWGSRFHHWGDMDVEANILWYMNQLHLSDTVRQHGTWLSTWR